MWCKLQIQSYLRPKHVQIQSFIHLVWGWYWCLVGTLVCCRWWRWPPPWPPTAPRTPVRTLFWAGSPAGRSAGPATTHPESPRGHTRLRGEGGQQYSFNIFYLQFSDFTVTKSCKRHKRKLSSEQHSSKIVVKIILISRLFRCYHFNRVTEQVTQTSGLSWIPRCHMYSHKSRDTDAKKFMTIMNVQYIQAALIFLFVQ